MKIDQESRYRVIYFIKIMTSYSFLNKIYMLNRDFVNKFEKEIRNPSKDFNLLNRHEKELLMYLYVLDIEEKSLSNFFKNKFKTEIYLDFFTENIHSLIFGRYGDEHALENDALYKKLGMIGRDSGWMIQNIHNDEIKKICITNELIELLRITVSTINNDFYMLEYPNLYNKWTFESFSKFEYWKFLNIDNIQEAVRSNSGREIEVPSMGNIEISGIYEPWFEHPVYEKLTHDSNYNPYVGCPNYFLEGATATQYKLEGTDQEYDVKWRLIWEDNRYLDGNIPEEEKNYILDLDIQSFQIDVEQTQKESLDINRILAGEKVPKSGYWFTFVKENSRQYFNQGDTFPVLKTDWGHVYWQYDGDK